MKTFGFLEIMDFDVFYCWFFWFYEFLQCCLRQWYKLCLACYAVLAFLLLLHFSFLWTSPSSNSLALFFALWMLLSINRKKIEWKRVWTFMYHEQNRQYLWCLLSDGVRRGLSVQQYFSNNFQFVEQFCVYFFFLSFSVLFMSPKLALFLLLFHFSVIQHC